MIIAQRGREKKARNLQHAKKVVSVREPLLEFDNEEKEEVYIDPDASPPDEVGSPPSVAHEATPKPFVLSQSHTASGHDSPRPKRDRKVPSHLNDYVVSLPSKQA